MIGTAKKTIPYIIIGIVFSAIYSLVWHFSPQRVGDGSEYYALFFAWSETFRPWMTETSFKSYELLFDSSEIIGLVPREWLEGAFPALKLAGTADFNHFWFYSFLAFMAAKAVSILGIHLTAHESYLILHFVFLVFTGSVAFKLHGWKGAAVFFAITLSSPIIWYFDKVHTELFTYCAVFSSVLFICRRYYLASSLFLALAATQNPSFALIALVPFAYRTLVLRDEKFSLIEVAMSIGTALLVLVHPIYYFLRFDVPTPQLLAGGADLGGNFSIFYIWLLDPDIGLFPNWYAGVFLLILSTLVFLVDRNKKALFNTWILNVFFVIFFFVTFYAQSSTTNINSGATPGLARYALWYIPIFFPVFLYLFQNTKGKTPVYALAFTIFVFIGFNLLNNEPRKHVDYLTPTAFSYLLQSKLSSFYNPPPEVFAERYSGYGEEVWAVKPRGILGPDCRKLLFFPDGIDGEIIIPTRCFLDPDKLSDNLERLDNGLITKPYYMFLDNQTINSARLQISPGSFSMGTGKNGNIFLASGWSKPQPWGVWSEGSVSSISFPCNSKQFYFLRDSIPVSLELQPFVSQKVIIKSEGETLFRGEISKKRNISFNVPVMECKGNSLDVSILISDPRSPFQLGQSADTRLLGIGLSGLSIGGEL